ncbi:transglutaminaseTgpA domain-containing protein [Dactylosporangium sp. AC04546]|uniref:transglutaminase family protein n=1 Tax=Dactylosporangium sp. AC04546 TaxID=2862460 RepID=UPI001EDD1DF2|nr:transglutaminase domain-containing protein [Dactylosporangium sp. AC04546]WVK89057.1 transglutaminaseTgpA domain-containing protein [Dactylosporangium sp. AC04546]
MTARVAAVTVMLALGAGAAGRLYDGVLFAVLVAGAAAGPAAVGLLLARRPAWTVAPASLLALAGYLAVAGWWAARSSGAAGPLPGLLAEALANGGRRLLTAAVPVEARPDTVVLPVVVVWAAGLTTTELVVRARRVPAALVPPALLYAGALVLAGPHGGAEPARAVAFVACAAVALLPGPQALARAGAVAAAAAVAAMLVALAVPDRPGDPRPLAEPPRTDVLDENPLARISGWMQHPGEALLEVSGAGPARLTLAVLGDFDGAVWRIGARYRDAGRVLPTPAAPADGAGETVRERITVRELGGQLVPAASLPRRVEGIRVAFDEGSGTLLRVDGPVAGTTYTVTSRVPRPDASRLERAAVPSGAAVARYLAAGATVPPDVAELARTIAQGQGGAHQRAVALQRFLAGHYRFDTAAPSGHAYPNLRFFLLGDPAGGGGRGTSEQFAAAYAVLGRLMGLPTRVVVGFTAPAAGGTVRGGDALAWPEVLFTGIGWVPFDPLPAPGVQPPAAAPVPPPRPAAATPPAAPPSSAPPSAPGPTLGPAPVRSRADAGHGWLPWGAAGGLLLAGQLGVVLARRAVTRRRLATGPPAARVRGAWLEVLDALRLAGLPPPAHLPATGVAAYVAGLRPGGRPLPPISGLAELANRTAFAREAAPSPVVGVWQALRLAAALRRAVPVWRRWCWPLHPGPLFWHSAVHWRRVGCSVFAKRTPDRPTVRAGGASSGRLQDSDQR